MKCDKCGKPATVHLTQIVGGQVKKMALCQECADHSGVTDPTGFALADLLLSAGQAQLVPPSPSAGRKCADCGFTMEDFKRTHRFGCAACYDTFRDEVRRMIRGMHRGAEHKGKVPGGQVARRRNLAQLKTLQDRLNAAVSSELYEEAATLRDEIRKLEGDTVATGRRP